MIIQNFIKSGKSDTNRCFIYLHYRNETIILEDNIYEPILTNRLDYYQTLFSELFLECKSKSNTVTDNIFDNRIS